MVEILVATPVVVPEATTTEIKNEEPAVVLEVVRPDFSVFDIDPISWTLFMSNDIEREDYMSIVFPGIPKYNNQKIGRRQLIEIPIQDLGTTKALVKEITFKAGGGQNQTVLTLATCKILFEKSVQVSFGNEDETITLQAAIQKILDDGVKSSVPLTLNVGVTSDHANFPGSLELTLSDNILDYLKTKFTNKKQAPLLSYWIDLFGVVNIQERNGINEAAVTFDYNTYPSILDLEVRVYDSWIEKEVALAPKLNEPTQNPAAAEVMENYSGNLASDPIIDYTGTSVGTVDATTSGATEDEKPNTYVARVQANNVAMSVTLGGILWSKVHKRFNISNVPLTDIPLAVLGSVTITDSGGECTTQLSFEGPAVKGPAFIDETKVTKKEDQKQGPTENYTTSLVEGEPNTTLEVVP